ncbi:hypothetical protein C3475_17930, partial [Mycobacterium kansasii]
ARHLGIHGRALEQPTVNVADADAALELLRAEVQPGDVILIKASNSAGLGALADALVSDGADGEAGGAGNRGSANP